jgi:RNA polymerase sigma-70 factor (ECF subfamily)
MATSHRGDLIQHLHRALREGSVLTDGQLLECYLVRREEAAFVALVRRHGPMVLGVCRRVLGHEQDAEDAFQATFLVLVRKAASVRPREKVANWLYGVAYHTALRARVATAKRRARERRLDDAPEPPAPRPDDPAQELRPVLDLEVSRLPDRYRVPVVLCDLEGKTHQEAARQLGWPVGTVSGRLSRARALLARRLVRHGLALSAGAVAAALAGEASAGVPGSLAGSTVRAATLVAAGQGAAGAVSANAIALAEEVLKAMLLSKLAKTTVVLLAAVVLAAGIGLFLAQASGADAPEKKAAAPAEKPPEKGGGAAGAAEKAAGAVSAAEVVEAFRTNEALADEKFRDRRVAVTGYMLHIRRSGTLRTKEGDKVVYELEMSRKRYKDPDPGVAVVLETDPILTFRFTEDDRAQLAKLKQGQKVTVEGRAEGHSTKEEKGREMIHFFDSKLLKVED